MVTIKSIGKIVSFMAKAEETTLAQGDKAYNVASCIY